MSLNKDINVQKQHRLRIVIVLLLLAVALWLRLRLIQTTTLWGDQAFTLNTAMRWVNGGGIPLAANKSSVGVMNPPMIEYVYALALLIWPDILSAALLTFASGMLALLLAAWVAYKAFGWTAGLWTLILFAFNPWSVFYSQLVWNQTMLPVFASLTLASLLLYFAIEQKGLYLVSAFLGLACMTQVHPGSWMQGVSMGVIGLVFWRRLCWKPLFVGMASFVLLYVPFLLYENGVGWMDIQAIQTMLQQPSTFSWAAVLVSLDLLHGVGLLTTSVFVEILDTFMTVLFGVSLIIIVVWEITSFKRCAEPKVNREMTTIFILLVWLLMPVLAYLRSSVYLQVYYLMSQWPASFIIMGATIGAVGQWLKRPSRQSWGRWVNIGLVTMLLIAVAGQIMMSITIQNERRDAELAGDKIQLGFLRDVIDEAEQLMVDRPGCDLVVLTQGHQEENSKLALMREFTDIEHVVLADGNIALPFPKLCAVYLDTQSGSRASNWLAKTAVSLPTSKIQQESDWAFYDFPREQRNQLLTGQFAEAIWENGIALVDLTRTAVQPAEMLNLIILWEVTELSPHKTYHIGTYLLTSDNKVVAQADGPGFDSIQWQPKDSFITWFDIFIPADLPEGQYKLGLAYYTWPNLERINLQNGENTYFAEEVEVPES